MTPQQEQPPRTAHTHRWTFDGDDPWLICDCGGRLNALTGKPFIPATPSPSSGLDVERLRAIIVDVIEREAQDALDTGIRPGREPELGAWNYVAKHFKQWAPLAADRILARLQEQER